MIKLKRIYSDDILLPKFMEECNKKGYKNNISISSIKFDYFEESAFFGLIETVANKDRILTLSGIHNFDFDGQRHYRIGFRAAAIYVEGGYKPKFNKDFAKHSLQCGVLMANQIMFGMKKFINKNAKFIMTTNSPINQNEIAGKSFDFDYFARKNLMPGVTMLYENITYLNTVQNVWLIDKDVYINNFEKYHKENIEILC